MARCEECLHFEVCEALELGNGLMKVPPIHCGYYKPTADVVPKSGVEVLEREIERLKKSMLPSYYSACSEEEAIKIGKQYGRAEVAREIFEDLDNLAQFIQAPIELKDGCLMITNSPYLFIKTSDYAELKKKYQEGEPNGN